MPKFRYRLGARIEREIDIFNPKLGKRNGFIVGRYSRPERQYGQGIVLGPYPELYAVRWSDDRIDQDFLWFGLDIIPGVEFYHMWQ